MANEPTDVPSADSTSTEGASTEITPEMFDGEQEAVKTESSPVKPDASPATPAEAEAKADPKAEEKPEVKAEADKAKAEETDGESAEETDKPTSEKPLAPKSENRFQNLANENRNLKRQVEQLTAQVYQPATEEELTTEVNPETGENYNRLEAKFEAYRQQQELEKYNSTVTSAQAELGNEAAVVLNEFPAFNPDSEQFDEELATEAAQLLEANLIRDPQVPEVGPDGKPTGQGIVVGSNISLHQLYKTLARASNVSGTKGQLKGQQAVETQLANADTASSATPPKKPKDPLAELWSGDL